MNDHRKAEILKACITQHVSMSSDEMEQVLSCFEPLDIKKGDHLLQAGKTCRHLAFIEEGFLRMYNIVDGKDITYWIGGSGRFITSVASFVFQTSNYWNIQAVTSARAWTISRDNHFGLGKQVPKWIEFDNLLLAHAFAILEKSMFAHLHTTARERYETLMVEEPELFNHVSLQYIASMLGIAPESLSRLRKKAADSSS